MCILFLYVSDKPTPDSFKVILAFNRDEMYNRPTKEATFWGTEPEIVGGIDMELGREGGTWLGISKSGRIGALLNILQSKEAYKHAKEKKGRGTIVQNFIQSCSEEDALSYMNAISRTSSEYNPFNLLTIDLFHDKGDEEIPQICYCFCSGNSEPVELSAGVAYGIGNSFVKTPFDKVKTGRVEFEEILSKHNHLNKRDSLIENILRMLKDEKSFHPDPQIQKQTEGLSETFTEGLSSRFVKLPGYGTRTHTIILIDYNNKVFYKEMTLVDPENAGNGTTQQVWKKSTFEFTINKPVTK